MTLQKEAMLCIKSETTQVFIQWMCFGMSTRTLSGFGQSSAHPLQDNRWIMRQFHIVVWCLTHVNRYVPSLFVNIIYAV